jgi:hypothetical protein
MPSPNNPGVVQGAVPGVVQSPVPGVVAASPTAVTTVGNADGLYAALQSAHSGDTILLAPGTYAAIDLSGFHFDGAVTIQSADSGSQAVLTGLKINGSSGLSFNHLVMTTPGATAVSVTNSSEIAFSALTVRGTSGGNDGVGFMIRDSSAVLVTGSDFSKIGSAIGQVHDNGLTLSNNTFHDLEVDGIFGGGSSHVVVTGNTFSDFHPRAGDHPDAIQFWGNADGTHGNDVTISDNVITRGNGEVIQGIFIENTDNVTITGNALTGTMFNGISVSTTDHALISGNFVQGFTDMDSRIVVRGQSVDVSVLHNTAQSVINYQDGGMPNPGYVAGDNTIIAATAASDLSAVTAWLALHAGTGAAQGPSVVTAPVVSPLVVPVAAPGGVGAANLSGSTEDLVQQEIASQLKAFLLSHSNWAVL